MIFIYYILFSYNIIEAYNGKMKLAEFGLLQIAKLVYSNWKTQEYDFLRGYCTTTRKLACFVCFLLHREENQYFLCMVVIDVCDSKSKNMIFFPWIYESLMWNGSKYFFLNNLRNHFKINRINSCFYYSWNHPFSVKKYVPMFKSSFTWLDLAIWSRPLVTIGDSNAP